MRFRSVLIAIIGALMLSESALALSCMRPDLGQTLEEAKASEKTYHILVGKFVPQAFETDKPPDRSFILEDKAHPPLLGGKFKPKPPRIIPTWFEGFSVGAEARYDSSLVKFPVDVETSCAGPWCGSVPSREREVIAFVQAREGQVPLLKIGPCPNHVFALDAEGSHLQKIRRCLDKSCS